MVKKANKKWRVCTNFIDLNKAYPKDNFPLPRIDQLVDAIAGHQLLTFIRRIQGITKFECMSQTKKKHIFITNQGLYFYNVLPFGLKTQKAY